MSQSARGRGAFMNEKFYKLFREKEAFQRYVARRFLFDFFQRLGFHVTGNHFYELAPDTRLVATNYSDAPRELPGINWRFAECERAAVQLIKTYGSEYKTERTRFGFTEQNYYYRGLDSLVLFVFLRELKPAKVVEIGQGFSTRIMLAALEQNAKETGVAGEFVSIDPYERLLETEKPKGVNFRVVQQPLQSVETALLENCDFLFVDSSHVYKFGSDVELEFTRIYPRLRPGGLLHLHDIYSPYHYPLDWFVREKRFWNEQYILENFLMFNQEFEVQLPLHLLARQSEAFLNEVRRLELGPDFKFQGNAFYLNRK